MIDLDNQSTLVLALDTLEQIADVVTKKDIELLIVDDVTIAKLNHEHRDKNCATDVLSFPIDSSVDGMHLPLGTIVIAASFVVTKAKEFNHTEEDELALLFIHGLLHLLGYDHESDEIEMREEEKQLIKMFDLPKSLIVRTEEL